MERFLMKLWKNTLFVKQQLLPQEKTKSCKIALIRKNSKKNKDQENVPNDCNRVILKILRGFEHTNDYINASFLRGFDRPRAYIVSQGPKFSTVKDFWRMIWQEQIEIIIMTTNFIENSERMCVEYWIPKINAIFECGAFNIRMTSETFHEHYDSRTLEVHYERCRREIRQFQLKWTIDVQSPLYPNDFVPIVQNMHLISKNSSSPILIHSSSGNNRAGTLILCDLALHMAEQEDHIDVYQLLKDMREQRPRMVNKREYYVLAHLIISEVLVAQQAPFKKVLKENFNPEVLQQQIKYVEKYIWHDKITTLSTTEDVGKKILNCIFVNSYKQSEKYVLTKLPKEKSIKNFWHTVSSESIRCILLLNPLQNKLWPYVNQDGPVVVKVTHLDSFYCETHTLHLLSVLVYDNITKEILDENDVSVFELHNWKSTEIVPKSPDNILDVIYEITKSVQAKRRILVVYGNKIQSSGLVTALFYLLEKYKNELEFDVHKALRLLKRSNLELNVEQLQFIYTALAA